MLAHALDWLLAMTIFTFGPSITYRTSANPFHTLGPSVTCRTSAIPFQTLGPSPTKFRSHDRYTPFMCRPGHLNMLAQTIPKSRPTHYLRVISNLGRDRLARFYRANVQPDWTALSVQSDWIGWWSITQYGVTSLQIVKVGLTWPKIVIIIIWIYCNGALRQSPTHLQSEIKTV